MDLTAPARDALDDKVNAAFSGKVVRKDLVRKVKVGANVPVFVLEFLLGKYCASSDPDELSKTDWSALVGGGLEYTLGRASVAIEGRYDLGLRSVAACSACSPGDVGRYENRAFTVTLGATYSLGR